MGGLWEFKDWELVTDYEGSDEECPHRAPSSFVSAGFEWHDRRVPKDSPELANAKRITPLYVWPLVAILANEGGYNSTGLCVLCLLDHLPKPGGAA